MKLRYTSLQLDVAPPDGASVGLASPSADRGGGPIVGLDLRPVVVCSLHSQLGVVAAVLAEQAAGARVAYVMTDGAALPLALSDLVADLCVGHHLAFTITAGHAFGGDIEAVNVPSALELAARAGADIVIVAMGPGVVGTGTALGTTALEIAPIVDAVAALGGAPIVAARRSDVDERARHRALSHHTTTALALAARPADVAHAAGTPLFDVPPPHRVVTVDVPPVGALLARLDLDVRTMGRGPQDDPLFFQTTAAAGVLAARSRRSPATVRP
jgi:hypothetical protein